MAQGRAGRPPAGHCCAAGPTRLAFRIPVLLLALNTPASGREAENKRPSALSGRLGARSGPEATHKDKGSPAELFSASSVKGSKRLIAIWDGGGSPVAYLSCVQYQRCGFTPHICTNLPLVCCQAGIRTDVVQVSCLAQGFFQLQSGTAGGLLVPHNVLINVPQGFWLPLSLVTCGWAQLRPKLKNLSAI